MTDHLGLNEHSAEERFALHRAAIEDVRANDCKRNRAVLALARHNAESTGIVWDTLPWSTPGDTDQAWYVMGAAAAVDVLILRGFIDAEIPPAAIEYRRAFRAYGRSTGATWPELADAVLDA